jgi:hypothetical protein
MNIPTQLGFVSSTMLKQNYLVELPIEIFFEICEYLELSELLQVRQCNKILYEPKYLLRIKDKSYIPIYKMIYNKIDTILTNDNYNFELLIYNLQVNRQHINMINEGEYYSDNLKKLIYNENIELNYKLECLSSLEKNYKQLIKLSVIYTI